MKERAALVGVVTRQSKHIDHDQALEELEGLALAAGATVALKMVQERPKPDPATFIGSGKVLALARACDEAGVDTVVFDNELSPAQLRNLETELSRKVLDRTQLILDIFARRARTREGKLQVELAQLQYLMPRLVGSSEALSRLGGGIGTRGPGETKLETDRRRIRHRIANLKHDIKDVSRRRAHVRGRREKNAQPTVALVGYTNAGKTTLFNLLTSSKAVASDALFVTLDPLIRRVRLGDGRQLLLSDTVGFIDRLPHQLVAAFHATLEEVAAADLLLHVIDGSAHDLERREEAVLTVLREVQAEGVPRLDVINKIDVMEPDALERLRYMRPEAMFISAAKGKGKAELLSTIAARLDEARPRWAKKKVLSA